MGLSNVFTGESYIKLLHSPKSLPKSNVFVGLAIAFGLALILV